MSKIFKKNRFVDRVKKWLQRVMWFSILSLVVLVIASYPFVRTIWFDTTHMISLHKNHIVSHSGWSFPGKIYSAPTPIDIPKKRRLAHAEMRNYEAKCPALEPGQYCVDDGTVIPRGGLFPEGVQPAGLEGWTRPLAFEPVFLSELIGEEAEIREYISIDEVPPHLIASLLASEDDNFYQHFGVNFVSLIRATIANIQGGGFEQGASTLTMQVVRNLTQEKKKNIGRKVREIIAAISMDAQLSKKEILEMYINIPYLGQYGDFSICGLNLHHSFILAFLHVIFPFPKLQHWLESCLRLDLYDQTNIQKGHWKKEIEFYS